MADSFEISADPSKYVTLPVQYEKIWRKYQSTLDSFWTVYDVYLADDKDNMNKTFNKQQQKCILDVLAFMFVAHHTTITKELFMQLIEQIDIKEATYYLGSQADSKKTHAVMYSMLLDELVANEEGTKSKLIVEMLQVPEIRQALKWCMLNVTQNDKSFARRILCFAALQGIIFAVPFALISYIHKQYPTIMPGLTTSNKYISRDEQLNLSFSCMLFEYIEDELDREEAVKIIRSAVLQAKNIWTKVINVSTLGLDADLIAQYIEYAADKILVQVRIEKIFNKENPFDWVSDNEPETNNSKILAVNNSLTAGNNYGEANFSTDYDF